MDFLSSGLTSIALFVIIAQSNQVWALGASLGWFLCLFDNCTMIRSDVYIRGMGLQGIYIPIFATFL